VQQEEEYCHAGKDGECNWDECPQLRDKEPRATGRHCPLDRCGEEEFCDEGKPEVPLVRPMAGRVLGPEESLLIPLPIYR
jgi:hypothetical protein